MLNSHRHLGKKSNPNLPEFQFPICIMEVANNTFSVCLECKFLRAGTVSIYPCSAQQKKALLSIGLPGAIIVSKDSKWYQQQL